MKILIFIMFSILLAACAQPYTTIKLIQPGGKLERGKGVLISVPDDGIYGHIVYNLSGNKTANKIRHAFLWYTKKTEKIKDCKGYECLANTNPDEYPYYVEPKILEWVDRATEWSGRRDFIKIEICVYDTRSKKLLAEHIFEGRSSRATLGGDLPEHLLEVPIKKFVDSLY